MRFWLLFLVGLCSVHAQKEVRKTLLDPATTAVEIDADQCFEVHLVTTPGDQLSVTAVIDGEYKENLLLKIVQEGGTAVVSTAFQPNFVNPNDKLSAHKVVSIALWVQLPRYKEVQVLGTSANVRVQGEYGKLQVVLNDGKCTLSEVLGEAVVTTQSGDIEVYAAQANTEAITKYGKVFRESIPTGSAQLRLHTVTGNIYLHKLE